MIDNKRLENWLDSSSRAARKSLEKYTALGNTNEMNFYAGALFILDNLLPRVKNGVFNKEDDE